MLSTRPALHFVLLAVIQAIASTALGVTFLNENSPPKASPANPKPDSRSSLSMSRAVVCRSIDGFEQFEPLGDAGQTSDEKLLVYYRPVGYKVAQRGEDRFVHFSQDGMIRRRGEKRPVRQKLKLLDIKSEGRNPPDHIFLRNTISLKDLGPGDYEYDIVLRDENAPGESATQTVQFRIVKSAPVRADETGQSEEEVSAGRARTSPKN